MTKRQTFSPAFKAEAVRLLEHSAPRGPSEVRLRCHPPDLLARGAPVRGAGRQPQRVLRLAHPAGESARTGEPPRADPDSGDPC